MPAPTLDQMIADAQSALHRLNTGTLAVEVDTGTYKTRFTATDIDKLTAYLAGLQAQKNGLPVRGAIGFIF